MVQFAQPLKAAGGKRQRAKLVVGGLGGPAGSGKTFIGLERMLALLKRDPKARVLFAARNKALPCFVAAWVGRRIEGAGARRGCA